MKWVDGRGAAALAGSMLATVTNSEICRRGREAKGEVMKVAALRLCYVIGDPP